MLYAAIGVKGKAYLDRKDYGRERCPWEGIEAVSKEIDSGIVEAGRNIWGRRGLGAIQAL